MLVSESWVFYRAVWLAIVLLVSIIACENSEPVSTIEAKLVQQIRTLGGEVTLSFGNVVRVNLSSKPVTDADLRAMTEFSELQELSLADTTITDQGLRHLRHFKRLRELTLSQCPRIPSEGLVHLQEITNLYRLQLSGNQQLGNDAMQALWPIRSLGKLDIYQTGVDDEGYDELVRRLPALKGNITH